VAALIPTAAETQPQGFARTDLYRAAARLAWKVRPVKWSAAVWASAPLNFSSHVLIALEEKRKECFVLKQALVH